MSEISNIAKTLGAYLTRPQLYPELGRKIYKNIFNRKAAFKGKEDAEAWCKSLAVSQKEAIEKTLNFHDFIPVADLYPKEFAFGTEEQNICPVKMGGAGALDLIYYLNEYTKATRAIETGVAYGWSSLAALLSLSKRKGTLYSSDMPYLAQAGDQYVGCVVDESLKPFWKLFRFADKESLPRIFKEEKEFDFIHYDSDKSYDGRLWAYKTLWPHLRQGGVMMSDDLADNAAFMDFCKQHQLEPVIVEFDEKYAGFIIKL